MLSFLFTVTTLGAAVSAFGLYAKGDMVENGKGSYLGIKKETWDKIATPATVVAKKITGR